MNMICPYPYYYMDNLYFVNLLKPNSETFGSAYTFRWGKEKPSKWGNFLDEIEGLGASFSMAKFGEN